MGLGCGLPMPDSSTPPVSACLKMCLMYVDVHRALSRKSDGFLRMVRQLVGHMAAQRWQPTQRALSCTTNCLASSQKWASYEHWRTQTSQLIHRARSRSMTKSLKCWLMGFTCTLVTSAWRTCGKTAGNGGPAPPLHTTFPRACPVCPATRRKGGQTGPDNMGRREAGNAAARSPRSVRHDRELTIPFKIVNPGIFRDQY